LNVTFEDGEVKYLCVFTLLSQLQIKLQSSNFITRYKRKLTTKSGSNKQQKNALKKTYSKRQERQSLVSE